MERQQGLHGRWRVIATLVALGWIGTAIVMLIGGVGGSTHRLATYALVLAMLAGLPVLTLMKNLSTHLTNHTEPDSREQLLVGISAAMVAAAWVLYAVG